MTAITVAPNSGIEGRVDASMAAFVRSMPCFKRTTIPSATTIALSTIIPNAITNAPNDILCKSMSKMAINTKVTRIVIRSAVPIITPIRQPIATVSINKTIAIA